MKQNTKRDRLTQRNKLIHKMHDDLCKQTTKSGKPKLTFEARLEILEAKFPPLSAAYIQQILQHEPHEFPKPKKKAAKKKGGKK